jgi:hypothetical protein
MICTPLSQEMNMNPIYLGDGVYAELEDERIILYTSNGRTQTNRIVLEPEVLRVFLEWLPRQTT